MPCKERTTACCRSLARGQVQETLGVQTRRQDRRHFRIGFERVRFFPWMASKPAPLVAARTRSTEKTKQEKEAAVRAAELASVVKQAAEEAASLAATQAVAAALAGVEARFAGIEEAHRQQVDCIAAGGASGSFGAPSISASEPPLFSPKARSTPPPPASPHPSDTAQAKRVLRTSARASIYRRASTS